MDGQFAATIIKIIVFLPIVLVLAYICLKIGGGRMAGMGNSRIIKVIEKVPLSARIFLCVVLINEKVYVIGCSDGKFEVLMELPRDSLKQEEGSFKQNIISNLSTLLGRKDKP